MSDKFTVDIKDFQSLRNVHLDLPEGVTIITGKTNEGKSAVFRAIDSALFNIGDDSMIRGGQRYYGVSIDNGTHKMVFMRDGKGKNEKSAYQFDGGTVQKKVGRTQLPEVAENFNIRDVRMQNGSKMKINFWYQNDKPFLTDKTSGQLYEFLSLSSCDKYSRVLKTMKADERVIESSINSVTAEIDTLKVINNKKQDFIDNNKGFDDTYLKVVTLSQESRKVKEMEDTLQNINLLKQRIDESKEKLIKVEEQFNRIPIDILTTKYNSIVDLSREIGLETKSVVDIEKLGGSINITTQRLEKIKVESGNIESVEKDISSRIESLTTDSEFVSDLSEIIDTFNDTKSKMKDLNTEIKRLNKKVFKGENKVTKQISQLDKDNTEISELIFKVNDIKDIEEQITSDKEKLNKTLDEIKSNDKDLEKLKDEAGYCPFCGTVFSK